MGQLLALLADAWVPITAGLILFVVLGEAIAAFLGLGEKKPWEKPTHRRDRWH